jgi:hypothetical protein
MSRNGSVIDRVKVTFKRPEDTTGWKEFATDAAGEIIRGWRDDTKTKDKDTMIAVLTKTVAIQEREIQRLMRERDDALQGRLPLGAKAKALPESEPESESEQEKGA